MIDIGQQIDYKIVPTDSLSIIGSNSKHTAGDLYTIDIKLQISQPYYQRLKRLLDLAVCIVLLPLLPLLSVALGNVVAWWRNWIHVLWGSHTWVGYHALAPTPNPSSPSLPYEHAYKLPRGILSPAMGLPSDYADAHTIHRLNLLYAKDYSPATDIAIIAQHWRELGREV